MGDSGAEGYRTVVGAGESAFETKGSTFRGRVESVDERTAAEAVVETVRESHPEATHVVSAYRVRVGSGGPTEGVFLREYADDDGEPGGSAGRPALTVLQRRDLENVVATVVRHYGGTNLGVGGLARAYGRAVGDAIDNAAVEYERPRERVLLGAGYDDSGTVRSILQSADVEFEATYEVEVTFEVSIPKTEVATLLDRLQSATSGRIEVRD